VQDRDPGAPRAGGNGEDRVIGHWNSFFCFILTRCMNGSQYAILALLRKRDNDAG